MSAVRRKTNRSNRTALASPYARPIKKSSWSFSGFLNYLNPLRRGSSTEEEEEPSFFDEEIVVDDEELEELPTSSPVQSLSRRGHQLTQNASTNGRAFPCPPSPEKPPQVHSPPVPTSTSIPSINFTFQASSSASQNLDTVTNFLTSHANERIASEDINQMVALIQQSKPEPFRFETRAATTPPRSKSPSIPPRGSSAPRTLSRNPNGSYTWKGAGSARTRRTRNSYSSPAFRMPRYTAPSNSTSNLETSNNDAKRRRVADSATEYQTSLTESQVPFPVTSPTTSRTTTSSSLKPPPATTPVRQRTPGLQKPTAPVVPSPLRQAWTGGSPSGSESGSPQGTNPLRQTETAKHVSELVNSLKSQDKVLDELRNPYEIANPVKRSTAPRRKRVVAPAKKPTVAAPPKEDGTKVKIKEMSAHAIIEATLPEGSKRSRPPADLESSAANAKEPLKVSVEDDETDEPRVSKRSKSQVNGDTTKETGEIEIESPQIAAKDKKEKLPPLRVPAMPAQPSASTKSLFGPKSSMPKEPSKLRFSMQAESTSTPPSPVPEPKANLQETPKPAMSGFTFNLSAAPSAAPEVEMKESTLTTNSFSAFTPPLAPTPAHTLISTPTSTVVPKSAKDAARSQPLTSLPTFTFTFPVPFISGGSKARDEAKTTPKESLPTFDLAQSIVPSTSSKGSFNWGATGMKPPGTSAAGEWVCSTCMLTNPASATSKCSICDTAKPGATAEAPKPAPSFNWAVAGMKPAGGATDGEWVCSQCGLKNPATATSKCGICDAPKPGASAESTPKTASFNWAAAGMKPPPSTGGGEWTCKTCGLNNPANATAKCTICDAARS
ncbi:hypothetical protein D9756_002449 [Leucocoprinus leucothites]|uniref:RanBP2-type domain-containing protein n=1 Tax=Leucocoprinus leucothites TaxID=201217 RepID=A0A8H5LM19_9AGAR|nr:hypothetical protein D9756_002449 [Leucoagaricus leucothites]